MNVVIPLAILLKTHVCGYSTRDVLAQLEKLSLILQEREINLSSVEPLVSSCY